MPDCARCGHPEDEHGQEREFYDCDGSRREVCLMCPGYEEPGYPNGQAWHRFQDATAAMREAAQRSETRELL